MGPGGPLTGPGAPQYTAGACPGTARRQVVEVPLLVSDFLNRAVKLYGPKEAVVDGDERFTYAQYGARSYQLAHGLAKLGVGKGDRVAILSPNSHHFLEAFYGVSALGAIIVPINYRLIASDFEYIVNHSGSKVFLVDSDLTETIDGLREKLPTIQHYVVARFQGAPTPAGWVDWEDVIAGQPGTPPPAPGLSENDLYSINYTSGTTARPKGVMLTHRNCYINAYDFIAHMRISHHDVELWTLPMFHANGWGGPFA
ncbi:MAG: AMP-binding protein [Dehalococcoidia bacterium]|nr:AMP-binding protein [Dehalococcoidia bacterium]